MTPISKGFTLSELLLKKVSLDEETITPESAKSID